MTYKKTLMVHKTDAAGEEIAGGMKKTDNMVGLLCGRTSTHLTSVKLSVCVVYGNWKPHSTHSDAHTNAETNASKHKQTHAHVREHARAHTRTHARTHARKKARTHALTRARKHARPHAGSHARTQRP